MVTTAIVEWSPFREGARGAVGAARCAPRPMVYPLRGLRLSPRAREGFGPDAFGATHPQPAARAANRDGLRCFGTPGRTGGRRAAERMLRRASHRGQGVRSQCIQGTHCIDQNTDRPTDPEIDSRRPRNTADDVSTLRPLHPTRPVLLTLAQTPA